MSDFGDNREFIDLFDICAVENFKLLKHARDVLLAVLDDFIFQIVVGVQKLVAIFIDRLALLVCDVVVFEDIFTRFKMQALDLFLRVLYCARNHA